MAAEPKPGYLTTEFWLTAAVLVIAAVSFVTSLLIDAGLIAEGTQAAAIASVVLKILSAASTTLAGMGYTLGRVLLKWRADDNKAATDIAIRVAREETERALRLRGLEITEREKAK